MRFRVLFLATPPVPSVSHTADAFTTAVKLVSLGWPYHKQVLGSLALIRARLSPPRSLASLRVIL